MVTTVELPALAFRVAPRAAAQSMDSIVTHLDLLGTTSSPPAGANDEGVTNVTMHYCTYLPARYAAFMLNPYGYTLKQTWDILFPAIVDANDLMACDPILKWLHIVYMGSPPLVNQVPSPTSAIVTLTAPVADQALLNHCLNVLKQALPKLHQPSNSLELAIMQMAAAVTQNTNDNRVVHDEKNRKELEPKLPSEKFSVTLVILLKYLQVQDEANLPQLWHQWAECNKWQEFQILSELLHAFTCSSDAFSSCAPVVSSKLHQDLLNFVFVSESPDDIKTGLQPFIIANGLAKHGLVNLELSQMHSYLASGETTLLYADFEALKAKEITSILLTFFKLERNLGMFGNLLGVILGCAHPITQAYWAFWVLLTQGLWSNIQQLIDVKGSVKLAHLLRSVQLVCYSWFMQYQNCLTLPTPDLGSILHTLTLNTYVLPQLSLHLKKLWQISQIQCHTASPLRSIPCFKTPNTVLLLILPPSIHLP